MAILESIRPLSEKTEIKAVLFDFDGTISTLRHGWEDIMLSMMTDMIIGDSEPDPDITDIIKDYINQSTGIQTIYQMQWLEEVVRKFGKNASVHDAWWYKDEYNTRLMEMVQKRLDRLVRGELSRNDFLIAGSEKFLQTLNDLGLSLYVASGTDHADVVREVNVLGLSAYFKEISGAPERIAKCSKEKVFRMLTEEHKLSGHELLVIGDGKVEISLAVELGAATLGMATDEINRTGLNQVKRSRLIAAGAHGIADDFQDCNAILNWLGIRGL